MTHPAVLHAVAALWSLWRARRYLAEPNELIWGCAGLEVIYYREGWFNERHLARVVARKYRPDAR